MGVYHKSVVVTLMQRLLKATIVLKLENRTTCDIERVINNNFIDFTKSIQVHHFRL